MPFLWQTLGHTSNISYHSFRGLVLQDYLPVLPCIPYEMIPVVFGPCISVHIQVLSHLHQQKAICARTLLVNVGALACALSIQALLGLSQIPYSVKTRRRSIT